MTVCQNLSLQYVWNLIKMQKKLNVKTFLSNFKENWCNSNIKMQTAIKIPIVSYDNYSNRAPFTFRRRYFENAKIIGHFRFVFGENSVREITWISWRHRFQKKPHFSKYFPSTLRRNEGVLKFLQFEEHFGKVPYSSRISCVQLG